MWRRQGNDEPDVRSPESEPDLDGVATAWKRWEERWDRPEHERVARWLTAKAGHTIERAGPGTGQSRTGPAVVAEPAQSRPDAGHSRPDAGQSRPDAGQSRQVEAGVVAASLEIARTEVACLESQRHQLAAALESERSDLQERRRRTVIDFQADQLEAERVIQLRKEASAVLEGEVSALEAEVSALEGRRREIVDSMDAAVAAAEQARLEEHAAVARLDAVQEQARRVEAEQFGTWVALDAEVTALQQRLSDLKVVGGASGDR